MRLLKWVHDRLTDVGAYLAALCVGLITFSYCYEVAARYIFDAPTTWANSLTTYLLLASVMLMFPYVTRERAHVAITFLFEVLSPRYVPILLAVCLILSVGVCLLSVWFTFIEVNRQFVRDVRTIDALLTPKWWLSAWFLYGFLSSGIYFLRQLVAPRSETPQNSLEAGF